MCRDGCPGREPDCPRLTGTGEETNVRIHVVNLHGDRAKEGRRSDRRHSANLMWQRVDSCVSVGASVIVMGVGISGELRGSTDVSKGAKQGMFDTTACKPVGVSAAASPHVAPLDTNPRGLCHV